jgi:hypothetical protein
MIILYLHAPRRSLRFALPCLYGSMPLHSFVTPIKELEFDYALKMGQSPLGEHRRFFMLLVILQMSQLAKGETDYKLSGYPHFIAKIFTLILGHSHKHAS